MEKIINEKKSQHKIMCEIYNQRTLLANSKWKEKNYTAHRQGGGGVHGEISQMQHRKD